LGVVWYSIFVHSYTFQFEVHEVSSAINISETGSQEGSTYFHLYFIFY